MSILTWQWCTHQSTFRESTFRGGRRVHLAIEKELIAVVGIIGLDVVILQPTVVFGPMGRRQWPALTAASSSSSATLPSRASVRRRESTLAR